MPEGPLGGPRPFARDRKRVLVLVGIDGPEPPVDVLTSVETLIQDKVNRGIGFEMNEASVSVTTSSSPTNEQKEALGPRTIHVQQYEVKTIWEEITQRQINAVHNTVVEIMNDTGFNITGAKTTVI